MTQKPYEQHISKTMEGISPAFGDRCIWVHRYADQILESKLERSEFKVTAGSDP